jgi:hypothetical protein
VKNILTAVRGARKGSSEAATVHQDIPDGTAVMDRRQLLLRAGALGLLVAAPVPLQRFWALDREMVPSQKFPNWAAALEPQSQNWLVWVQAPGAVGAPYYKVVAARTFPELVDGGHWQMIYDAQLRHDFGPSSMIRFIEGELSHITGIPAKVTQVNGIALDV